MPADSLQLRADLTACIPSILIDDVAKESGQRVVYFAHFDDSLIPEDILSDPGMLFLRGWEKWNKVVVKVVAGISASALTRLQAEANLLEEISSPQFPKLRYSNYFTENPITDEILKESMYVSIEEYIESVPLSAKLNSYINNPTEVFKIAKSVVIGLRPLWEHKRKFVHRDVKPDNLLITPEGTVVIIDFGIIRETGVRGITIDGRGMAPLSADYTAPEQIDNDKDLITFKTDFFSLGVIMYQLISGVHPFISSDVMSIIDVYDATESHIPPTLFSLGMANEHQSNLVSKMMEKKLYLRPRTIDLLLQELE